MKLTAGFPLFMTIAFTMLSQPHSAQAVIAGTPLLAGDPIALTTAAFLQDELANQEYPGGTEQDACSGTLIADDTYVTAAHCIEESPVGKKLLFAVNIYNGDVQFRVIDQFKVNPQFKSGYANGGTVPKNNSDIALLHFAGGLPTGYHPADVLPSTYQISGTESVVIAGYGILNHPVVDGNNVVVDPYAWLGDGILRQAVAGILDPDYAETEIEVKESSQSYAASGDSGGPAFITVGNQNLLVGVDNWGDVQNGNPFEVYADVRSYLSWFTTTINEFHKNLNPH